MPPSRLPVVLTGWCRLNPEEIVFPVLEQGQVFLAGTDSIERTGGTPNTHTAVTAGAEELR